MPVRLGARDVSRAFGSVRANAHVSLDVQAGTVHAVVGENGAGKTTLMRILYGLDQPDSGTVVISDRPVRLRGPADGIKHGIGLVQQELAMVGSLTLLENLILGAEPRRGPRIDWPKALAEAEELAAGAGVELPWQARTDDVSISVRQQVEILRALRRGADVLILDEPTAALAPAQVDELLRLLRGLRDAGRTVVFISHKLDEVLAIADEITVLRGGEVVTTRPVDEVTRSELVELIVGSHVESSVFDSSAQVSSAQLGDEVLLLEDRVSLTVRAGEIVGVAGVAGNGQDELVERVVGLRKCAGRIVLDGNDVTALPVDKRRALGLGYVSGERGAEGLSLDASLADNTIAGTHRGLARRGWLPPSKVRAFVQRVLDGYSVRYGRTSQPARTLSGGNQQRVVIGRELDREPRLLVAAGPTRGVDVLGIEFIHSRLRALRDNGSGVLLVSEQLDELLELSDRIVVLHGGAVAGEVPGGPESRYAVGELMLGRKPS
ncbi:simple sugar transport system ATP-binding protein [Kibdelosporangium banguiense]|uniref:Simple sugar transport system ATP-binding protein n=1 Tax=Kibdelosporangium banguiense TaxID=1365924 RepID=A0ABS4U3Q7_9PSEU|nr:ABC transporter ATP-binding protein [Kibdelosporangium banguiense]MBP2331290.1 simple sugar transport system ATP-binding protein [Kibdelosporangium banguiense]